MLNKNSKYLILITVGIQLFALHFCVFYFYNPESCPAANVIRILSKYILIFDLIVPNPSNSRLTFENWTFQTVLILMFDNNDDNSYLIFQIALVKKIVNFNFQKAVLLIEINNWRILELLWFQTSSILSITKGASLALYFKFNVGLTQQHTVYSRVLRCFNIIFFFFFYLINIHNIQSIGY